MATLFNIVGEFERLYDMAVNEELDTEAFEGTLEALTGELEVKGAGYVAVLQQLDMEQKKAEEIAGQFKLKADLRKSNINRMKNALKIAMERLGAKEIPAGDYTIKLQKNGGKLSMDIDKENVPDGYMKVIYEPDNELIRKDLESGKELPFAWLNERGTHVVIK